MTSAEELTSTPAASGSTAELLQAILDLAGHLDIHTLLERFVAVSIRITGARYGAINIVDELGASTTFVQSGVDERTAAALGHAPHAWGVLGQIPDDGVLRLQDLSQHPAFGGLPTGHPPMHSFLGAPVQVRGERYGTLYLSQKDGGFDDQDEQVVLALAAGAAVAVQNAQLYAIERRREQWLNAGQRITTMLLEGSDDQEDVLLEIAATARHIDGADTAALVLPGRDGDLMTEIVSGTGTDLLGLDLTDDVLVRAAFDANTGHIVRSLATHPEAHPALARYGPALFAPLRSQGQGMGVLVLLRRIGVPPFTPSDLNLSQTFAAQAALAFLLAEARRAQGQIVLHDERTRIARDLHDMAIQQLIAAGMQLDAVHTDPAQPLPAAVSDVLDSAMSHIASGVRQVRVIVRALDDPGATIPLVDRVWAEIDLARSSLGFTPSLLIALDGRVVQRDDPGSALRIGELLAPGRANNVVAVVREGLSNAARHARPTSVAVRVAVTTALNGRITVEVEDDGVGVPAALSRASGTKNLAVRAEQDGGSFALLRPPSGRGALLRWSAPLH